MLLRTNCFDITLKGKLMHEGQVLVTDGGYSSWAITRFICKG